MAIQHGIVKFIDGYGGGLEIRFTQAKLNRIVSSHIKHPPDSSGFDGTCPVGETSHEACVEALGI
jgi:hypothetical protein